MKNIKAFSLIELLISLIIISLVAAAFTPVLTKNLKKQTIAVSANNSGITSECDKIDSNCELCYEKEEKCIMCNRTCLSNQYVDIAPCKCVNCSENCLSCNSKVCLNCATDTALMDDGTCKKCSQLYGSNCTTCNKTQCLSCKTDFKLSDDKKTCISIYVEPSEDNCAKINALFIPAKYNGTGGKNLCVTKYNAGDSGGASIPSGVQRLSVNLSDHSSPYPWATNPRCWSGRTAASSYADACNESNPRCVNDASAPFDYSPCNRTLCNWYAAKIICSNYSITRLGVAAVDWRLPKENELKGWAANINAVQRNKGTSGLQLCDRFSGYGSPTCHHTHRGCDGAVCGFCSPYTLIGETVAYSLGNGGFGGNGLDKSSAYSVRCVIDKLKKQ